MRPVSAWRAPEHTHGHKVKQESLQEALRFVCVTEVGGRDRTRYSSGVGGMKERMASITMMRWPGEVSVGWCVG